MPDASTQTTKGKKIQLIVKETHDEEEICNTCKKYLDHDEDDKKCGVGCKEYDDGWKETHDEEEDVEYWNKVDYFVTCDICGRDWDKKHDHRLVGALCHSWAYQTRAFCCPSCIDAGKCECDDCDEPSDSEDEEQAYKMVCENCEYTLSRYDWGWGKGRIMFNDLEDGKFRCGVCDDRVNDPQGMNPNDEEE